jgi:hypothetical protein
MIATAAFMGAADLTISLEDARLEIDGARANVRGVVA